MVYFSGAARDSVKRCAPRANGRGDLRTVVCTKSIERARLRNSCLAPASYYGCVRAEACQALLSSWRREYKD